MYAVGPSPAKPGQVIGSAGPTTTARMGRYLPTLFAGGVRAMIGKGELHGARHGRVHRARRDLLRGDRRSRRATGQADQRGEGGRRMRSSDPKRCSSSSSPRFPAVVIIDRFGQNLHETARAAVAHRAPDRSEIPSICERDAGLCLEYRRGAIGLRAFLRRPDPGMALASARGHGRYAGSQSASPQHRPDRARAGSWSFRTSTAR